MKPRIAIPIPTTTDIAYNQRSWPQYESAILRAGGEPVPVSLTLTPAELRDIIATVDGVLLPGSPADVDPLRYTNEVDPSTAPADPARELTDFTLLDDAIRHGKPALGICFGVQSMNAWRGGSLVQDITPLPVNHSAGPSVAIAHSVLIARESTLGGLVDPSEATEEDVFFRLPINTSHHQAVSAPGDGLRVVARCPDDGVIEAVELDPTMFHVEHSADKPGSQDRSQFLLGVQWHPERSYDISATSRNLFVRLVVEAKTFAAARTS
jgi:putative glutamine amidotransferase